MKVVVPGHVYELDNLKDKSTSRLQFYCDPAINGIGLDGPSSQEVLRALIDRVAFLEQQKPHRNNVVIIEHLRQALALFETRALELKVAKGLPIETFPVGSDGHIVYKAS